METPKFKEPVAKLGLPSEEVLYQLTSSLIRVTRRVEIYEADGETPFEVENWNRRLVSGSISVDRTRDERRACDILLENSDGQLDNDPSNGFWYDKILKVFWGIRYQHSITGEWDVWETPLGEFMIDRLDEDRFPNAVKVTGRDFTKKCIQTRLTQSLSFPSSTPVESIVKALASNAGIKKFELPVTNKAYSSDVVFARNTPRWEVMKNICDSVGYEVYFKPNGTLTMTKYTDPVSSPLVWTFEREGRYGTLVDYKRSSNDSSIFNHITVEGATTEVNGYSTTIFAEAKNTNPSSPTNIERIGDRVKDYKLEYITTKTEAQNMADTMLKVNALEEYDVSLESSILPFLEPGMIVGIVEGDESVYDPKRFLLDSYSVPLDLGTMSASAKRVTIVGSEQSLEDE